MNVFGFGRSCIICNIDQVKKVDCRFGTGLPASMRYSKITDLTSEGFHVTVALSFDIKS